MFPSQPPRAFSIAARGAWRAEVPLDNVEIENNRHERCLGDSRMMAEIDAAHTAAVNAALRYVETHASLSRRGRDGVEQIESAGITAACFDHRTSRTGAKSASFS